MVHVNQSAGKYFGQVRKKGQKIWDEVTIPMSSLHYALSAAAMFMHENDHLRVIFRAPNCYPAICFRGKK